MAEGLDQQQAAGAGADFTRIVDRTGTWSTKWDRYRGTDVLPFWVADMEFPAPPAVIEALHARVAHGVFGYTQVPETLTETTLAFLAERYGWSVEPEWLVWIPGVVPGFNLACRAVGEAGDAVMTATPIYYPFLSAPANAGREKVETALVRDGDRWVMDFDALQAALTPRTRLFMLCNPHNPTGRVYDRDELLHLARIAAREDLILCSDEIHAELILEPGLEHIPIATLDPEIARRTITLMAPTKTYNIPGLSCAYAVIPDPTLRRAFRRAGAGLLAGIGPLGFAAAEAAYAHGEPWRQQLLAVLRANRDRLQRAVDAWPGLSMTHVEATCLAWIDTRERGLKDPQAFFEAAGVGLSPGTQFAGETGCGEGFVRFNFGCQADMLEVGIARMDRALAAAG
ncbi:MAG TPA: PatB family C-S lyase [Pseudomonadales bacterium]|nr:PatB family C-S lyase [Pseudomonadales bacterium]